MSVIAWVAVAVFVGAYALIATEKIHRIAAALGGAAIMLVIGATTPEDAFFSEKSGIDWNVIFLLLGMMLIVSVLRRTGVFEYLAIWAVKRAAGRPYRVMVLLVLVTALASAILDNVTTILLIAPVTFLVCERLKAPVAPFLIAEVLASNIGGTATLVGDPPNIIIAARADLSYNDFLIHLAPIVLILLVVFIGLCRVMFRSAFTYDPDTAAQLARLRERDAIKDSRLLVISLVMLVVVTAAFMVHTVIHIEPSVVAMVGGLGLLALSRLNTDAVLKDVEWHTLVFFAGLFILVGSLVSTGVIAHVSQAATEATGDRVLGASMLLLWGSAFLSAIVDNIPYVTTMSPVVADMAAAQPGDSGQVLWWSLALGADLGGNATAVGASANVVMLGMAERAGKKISFWQFTKYGLVTTVVTIALATPYLWLRYFVLT
ncbi:SLC13 family permease [Stackebrandtia nassauensis]|uniref:Citrate transporter n=1 Tax=Stackebrandtia nassauensis (strain DSM 44728 / CIP 108903 / NRRL B-16338 / NBRC 102104 / LLR-40K-21) TaxID=446470 RepID=D3PXJ7_STANL|nr:ArsB/NhaD family transporter [Stackebrandtia nassauensis]ADD43327.1 Citrate transporter [Stackebrandtia nassauensis DSM 44728]